MYVDDVLAGAICPRNELVEALNGRFHFNVQEMHVKPGYTKREVLSCVAKLFDPTGWLGPIVIEAKILMQDIWLTKIDWDDNIPRSIYVRWENFLKNYVHISKSRIPRWVRYTPWNEIEFHGFCDASEKAYAAVLYVRVRKRNFKYRSKRKSIVVYKWTDSSIVL
ncbi:uncharacterized protein LOC110118833 [Ceratitis capitata]|uniref:uncharacterized protein LOC110118833 n=1 Tax=Ceratitis capitata TaxID=7213 RepID=UPI000A119FDE|nr:uncharacterized protein LOC110118833 [Ceratitis capitata]